MSNINKAREAGKYLEEAEDCGRDAKELFKEIGDPDGIKKASEVERVAREAKEYIKERIKNR